MTQITQRNNGLEDCIRLCWETRNLCQTTLYGHCLPTGGPHAAAEHVELMTGCMEICQAAADFMTRTSAVHTTIASACAVVCDATADSCEAILCGDLACPEMQLCADTCRRCATACRTIGQETGTPVVIPEHAEFDASVHPH